ncbi:nuclear cap-binding protein subunit 3 isoform X2 [Sphaerodactylus townsendi]|uniref:nuclear cap-binding protein subunit 3 isoform X2 n=1 Tax=Sphaerodactylus townsendi TaxID=933632 RepID=UPI0020275498|nr:nuclear cap-binding protein subunit 3 isoform X2 [Sphaerodactylus townsendi]
MAAVRGLRISVKAADPEPMEVEEGELQAGAAPPPPPPDESSDAAAGPVPVRRSLRELLPDMSRRYENKAGSFITGIDVNSKEAIEKKEQRAKRFHFRAEVNLSQRNVALDRDMMKKAIPKVRLDTLYVCGVDEMSTQDIFAYFKEYPSAHIEWLDDTSCNVVWLDEVTATRALINMSSMPEEEKMKPQEKSKKAGEKSKKEKEEESSDDETEEGEVEDDHPSDTELDTLSQAEEDSLLRNDLRPACKLAKGNKLFMRFATQDDKKELGAARRSQYYMKYGNPNYGGMKGILSNSWKRRYHSRRVHRDVIKKRTLIGDDVGLASPYKHRHSGLVNVPEEPIEEEEEEEEEEDDNDDQDMDEDDRVVVEYRDELQAFKQSRERSAARRSSASESDSDEMDYDLELKMISTPSPKKTMKMTMYADAVESQLKSIRNSMRADTVALSNVKNRIGSKGPSEKVADVRLLLEEKRHGSTGKHQPPSLVKSDVRQRLGKRPHSPEPKQLSGTSVSHREPISDVHSRLGIPKQDVKGLYSDTREKKSANLWTRLGSASKMPEKTPDKAEKSATSPEEDDSELQRAWGALIKEKEQSRQKKSRLDNLPSLQIEISRESSSGSDTES